MLPVSRSQLTTQNSAEHSHFSIGIRTRDPGVRAVQVLNRVVTGLKIAMINV
jgi:hypothetical protein